FGIWIFDLNRFQSLAVIPAKVRCLKFFPVKEMRNFFSIYCYPERRLLSVDHINLHILHSGLISSFIAERKGGLLSCFHSNERFQKCSLFIVHSKAVVLV